MVSSYETLWTCMKSSCECKPRKRVMHGSVIERACLHGGRGQVSVLILESSVQCQPPFLLVVSQQRCDAQGILIGSIGLHCLSVEVNTQTNSDMSTACVCVYLDCLIFAVVWVTYPNSLIKTDLVYLSAE